MTLHPKRLVWNLHWSTRSSILVDLHTLCRSSFFTQSFIYHDFEVVTVHLLLLLGDEWVHGACKSDSVKLIISQALLQGSEPSVLTFAELRAWRAPKFEINSQGDDINNARPHQSHHKLKCTSFIIQRKPSHTLSAKFIRGHYVYFHDCLRTFLTCVGMSSQFISLYLC